MSESFSALLDESLETLDMKQGSIVSGVVLDVDKDWVTVHVGLKSEGIISLDEFRDNEGKTNNNKLTVWGSLSGGPYLSL